MSDTEPIKIVGRTQVLETAYVWNNDGKSIRLMTEEEKDKLNRPNQPSNKQERDQERPSTEADQ